jgi:spore germination protein YaaH
MTGEVYGFVPYWLETPKTVAGLRMDLLTTVSFFDVGFRRNGSLERSSLGYPALASASSTAIIRAAHAVGVRADLTLASFGFLKNRAFLRSGPAQRRLIAQVAALVRSRGLDGVTVDFESVYRRDLPAFGQFVDSLRRAIRAHNPAGRVTVAVGASQAGVAMASAVLKQHADRVLIMGYDYRGAGSTTTGSTDPLVSRNGGMSLTWTLNLTAAAKLPMKRLILALPYYGMTWPTKTRAVGAAPDRAKYRVSPAYPIRVSKVTVPAGARTGYDPVEATAWVITWDAHRHVWRQTYFDSPKALQAKFALAKSRGLAGIGLWALGYDAGSIHDWKAIAAVYRPPRHHKVTKKAPSVHRIKAHKMGLKPKTVVKHKTPAKPKPARSSGASAV